ncbi:FAD:protein FMN transferase [Phaeovulum sp.]|uniref:FAD:protein FMN transferase n=1 Tax=Phaeovulum sp. TaxID=2934796 RepID=UPI003564E677
MNALPRRRFLQISAAALAGTATGVSAQAAAPVQWRGVAMGAGATITLAHPDAEALIASALAEIARLERIFSLHDAASAVSRLNATGRLETPPFELLECFALCSAVHTASGGRFDPTVQPLWQLYAESAGQAPAQAALAERLALVGWQAVRFDADAVHLPHPGMAITLNGVAQGYVADRVAALLRTKGLRDVLVNTGEFHALGVAPDGHDWRIALDDRSGIAPSPVSLRDGAMASSAPRGTTFDAAEQIGHILDPQSGLPARTPWQLISVTAPQAALADALSTAMCLMDRAEMTALLGQFPAARLVHLS